MSEMHHHIHNQQELRKLIEKTKALHADRIIGEQRQSMTTYKMARHLAEVKHTEACERTLGVSFKRWVSTLRDGHGRPRSWSWARSLISLLKTIDRHPLLVKILETQEPDDAAGFIEFSSAYYCARLCEEDYWKQKIGKEVREMGLDPDEAQREKDHRLRMLYYEWGTRGVNTLKDRIKEIQSDKEDANTPKSWPYYGGPVDPAVKERYDEAVERLARVVRPDENIDDLSYTQEMETIAEGVTDLLEAMREVKHGNTSQLEALLEYLDD